MDSRIKLHCSITYTHTFLPLTCSKASFYLLKEIATLDFWHMDPQIIFVCKTVITFNSFSNHKTQWLISSNMWIQHVYRFTINYNIYTFLNVPICAKSFSQAHFISGICQACNDKVNNYHSEDLHHRNPTSISLINLKLPPTNNFEDDMHRIIWKIDGWAAIISWLMCLLTVCLSMLPALLKKAMSVT